MAATSPWPMRGITFPALCVTRRACILWASFTNKFLLHRGAGEGLADENGLWKSGLDHYGYAQEIKTSRNKIERNITLLERALEDSPQEPTLLMSYALDLYNRGDVEKALETNRQAFQIVSEYPPDGISPEVRERLLSVFSNLLLQSEMHEELIEVAESQLAKDCGPTSSILFMYARTLQERSSGGRH